MSSDTDHYVQLSELQHFVFCRRQWGLIYLDGIWEENLSTIEGKLEHEKVDDPFFREKRKRLLIARGLKVISHEHELLGKCDVVEFLRDEEDIFSFYLDDLGKCIVYPVEYKHGKEKATMEDEAQLIGQVFCLEEMFATSIPKAYIFYKKTKERVAVDITPQKRILIQGYIQEIKQNRMRNHLPRVKTGPKCRLCSLRDACFETLRGYREVDVSSYIDRRIKE